jgi:Raf kinase inhibitor-like YbhB/YbcL family protein
MPRRSRAATAVRARTSRRLFVGRTCRSLALVVDDPDAPGGVFTHWIAWGLDPAAEGPREGEPAPYEGKNDFGATGYRGPCPPPGHGRHRYGFRLYALDADLELGAGVAKTELEQTIEGHVLTIAELVGTSERGSSSE